ncbi:MAG: hypothetical protein ABJG88_11625 [Litorimonas sp.]
MQHPIHHIWKFIGLFGLILTLTACQAKQPNSSAKYSAERGQSVIAFTDAVPIFRKNGIFWKYGANHNSILSSPIAQDHAKFELYQDKGAVIWTPNVGPISPTSYAYFDASIAENLKITPFVNIGDTLYLMVQNNSDDICSLTAGTDTPISNDDDKNQDAAIDALFGFNAKISPRLFKYFGKTVHCITLDKTQNGAWMMPLETSTSPTAMGFFFTGKKGQVIQLKNFHLGTNLPAQSDGDIQVKLHQTLDGKTPEQLHLLTHDGVRSVLTSETSGQFTLPRSRVQGGPFRLWADDNTLAVFPSQGEWIDPAVLTDHLSIKQSAEFPINEAKKNRRSNKRKRTSHKLSVWSGSSGLVKIQEYEGLTFTNNLGYADRDRAEDNTNNCLRGVIFGGSYVEAAQTKIVEKPAIMTEALAAQKFNRCVEFFSYAKSLGRAENYVNDAKELIRKFGMNFVVFSTSRNELCSHIDDYYIQRNGRGLMTPKDWRIVNGVLIPPVPKDKAETFKPNKEAAKAAIENCRYDASTISEISKEPLKKMQQIETLLKAENKDLQVLFFNFKDVLAKNVEIAQTIQRHCKDYDLQCHKLSTPYKYEFDEPNDRFSPHLYRYKQDAHPNVRANQYIAQGLTDMLVQVYDK